MDAIRQRVLVHADTLAGEMNFRLLFQRDDTALEDDPLLRGILSLAGKPDLWRELCDPQKVLFVESVTVTDIAFPVGKEKNLQKSKKVKRKDLFSRIGTLLSRFGRRRKREA